MSETTQYTTFADLYQGLLRRVRVSTGVVATDNQAKHYINVALQDIHLGFDYKLPWCEANFYLRTKAPYTTGTISASVGGSSFTGTSTAWATNDAYGTSNAVAHGKIFASGDSNIYKVSSVDSNTQITLYTKYVADSALTDSEYIYFEDEYTLTSAFLRPVDLQMFSPQMGISLISRSEFRRRYPVVNVSGRPRVACIIDSRIAGTILTPVRKVVFYPYPDQAYIIPYTYISSAVAVTSAGAALTSMSSDTDEPIMPLRYRHAIIFHALSHWYRDRKDDARSQSASAEYQSIMERIVGDHDIATHTTAYLQPRGGYVRAAQNPYSYRGGRRIYDLNDEFDSFKR